MTDEELIANHPPRTPICQLVWTAVIDVGARMDLGPTPDGRRFMIPILGGRFYPGKGMEGLGGVVLSGGADRQLLRADGVKELNALYEMQTDEGAVITVHNKVIVDESRKPHRYAMSVISATVPTGPLDWLNQRILVGTLQSARPTRQAVIVRAWCVDSDPKKP